MSIDRKIKQKVKCPICKCYHVEYEDGEVSDLPLEESDKQEVKDTADTNDATDGEFRRKLIAALKAKVAQSLAIPENILQEKQEDKLAEATKPLVKDVTVVRSDTPQIVLPNGMSYDDAAKWIMRKRDDDEKAFAIHREFDCSPLDGLVAMWKAMSEKFGWVSGQTIPGGFFSPDKPPMMVSIAVGPNQVMEVGWGRFMVPTLEGYLETGFQFEPVPKFIMGGQVKQKHKQLVHELGDLIEQKLKTDSIYRGRAIKLSYQWMRDEKQFDPMEHAPKFLTLDAVEENDLILPTDSRLALEQGLFTPIEYSEACAENQIPLKRTILLAGPFGVGKTLTAYVTAKKAVRNGFSFIYLDSVLDLELGLRFAIQYGPAVVFVEDIDRITSGERTMEIDDITNIMDGMEVKGRNLITVLTTNNAKNINPAILRPGRIDVYAELHEPDAEAAITIVKKYGRGLLAGNIDYAPIGEALKGHIQSHIREVVERAKLAAIMRMHGGNIRGKVTAQDILDTVTAMEAHAALLQPPKVVEVKPRIFMGVLGEDNARAHEKLAEWSGERVITRNHDGEEEED